jgi:hypothetical protein
MICRGGGEDISSNGTDVEREKTISTVSNHAAATVKVNPLPVSPIEGRGNYL